jgi:hypothetical protein
MSGNCFGRISPRRRRSETPFGADRVAAAFLKLLRELLNSITGGPAQICLRRSGYPLAILLRFMDGWLSLAKSLLGRFDDLSRLDLRLL